MAFTGSNFTKLNSDRHLKVVIGPDGSDGVLGITDLGAPLADELNNTGGTSGVQDATASISWSDWGFGFEASETANEPSLADISTYEDRTTMNYGGDISMFMPAEYDDNSNQHSVIYDLTDEPGVIVDIATRLDGAKKESTPFADGDFVHTFRVQGQGETNPFTPGESTRRTVGFASYGEANSYTIVGAHTLTQIGTTTFTVGAKGRIRIAVQDRDYTNALSFRSSDSAVIDVYPGGFYEVIGAGSATITVEDKAAGTSLEITGVAA